MGIFLAAPILKPVSVNIPETSGGANRSVLERLVKQDLSFDPERRYFDIQTFERIPNYKKGERISCNMAQTVLF